jgi:hypothetical protein
LAALGVLALVVYAIVDRRARDEATSARIEAEAAEGRALRDRLSAQAEVDREAARVRREADEERRRQQRLAREEADTATQRVREIMIVELASVVEDPDFIRLIRDHPRLQDVESEEEAHRIALEVGEEMSVRGFALLPTADLGELNRLRLLLAQADETLCGQLWTGGTEPRALLTVLASFSDDDLRSWSRLSARAIRMQLDRPGPSPALDAESLAAGFDFVADDLDGSEEARFQRVIAGEEGVSPADGCFAVKSILSRIDRMPGPLRARFTRAFAVAGATE